MSCAPATVAAWRPSASAWTCSSRVAAIACSGSCRTTSSNCAHSPRPAPSGRRSTRWRMHRFASTSPTDPSAKSRSCTTSCSPPSTTTPACSRATSSSWCPTSTPTRPTCRRCSACRMPTMPVTSRSAWPTRGAAPTIRCWPRWRSSPACRSRASAPARCSTCSTCRRCAGVSVSTLPTCRSSPAGFAVPACAGASTPVIAPASACPARGPRLRPTAGCSACGGCCWATPPAMARPPGRGSNPSARSAASVPRCSARWSGSFPASNATGACSPRRRQRTNGSAACAGCWPTSSRPMMTQMR